MDMGTRQQPRKPAGTPVGGQFAPTAHDEDDIDLPPSTKSPDREYQDKLGLISAFHSTLYSHEQIFEAEPGMSNAPVMPGEYHSPIEMGLRPYARPLQAVRSGSRFDLPGPRAITKLLRVLRSEDGRLEAYQEWLESQRDDEKRRAELFHREARTERYGRAISTSERMRSHLQCAIKDLEELSAQSKFIRHHNF